MDWRVYHIKAFPYLIPPKNKFLLVFQFEDGVRGFLINTGIPKFFKKRGLLPCIATIPCASNAFLDYDSHIDCSKFFSIEKYYLYNIVCAGVCNLTKHRVIKSILSCRTLTPIEKNHILAQYQAQYFNLDLEK